MSALGLQSGVRGAHPSTRESVTNSPQCQLRTGHPASERAGDVVLGQLRFAPPHPRFTHDIYDTIREALSSIVRYQAARFPVANLYLMQFYHSRW
jgi:hypothetical protein